MFLIIANGRKMVLKMYEGPSMPIWLQNAIFRYLGEWKSLFSPNPKKKPSSPKYAIYADISMKPRKGQNCRDGGGENQFST